MAKTKRYTFKIQKQKRERKTGPTTRGRYPPTSLAHTAAALAYREGYLLARALGSGRPRRVAAGPKVLLHAPG